MRCTTDHVAERGTRTFVLNSAFLAAKSAKRALLAFVVAGVSLVHGVSATSAMADDSELAPIEVGQPAKLDVFPAAIRLTSARQSAQIVVTGVYADGAVQDLTRAAAIASSNEAVVKVIDRVAVPQGDGTADVKIESGGQQATIPVEVSGFGQVEPVSFEFGTLVALSKQGCNSGACHGSPSGKGGFRLSLRAFDPTIDQLTLIREDFGRRINVVDPEQSLLLLKPLMKTPHGGGLQLTRNEPAYAVLRDWIAEGGKLDPPDRARCVRLEIHPPADRVLKQPAHTQQFAVIAHFADGTSRDVTALAAYSSSNEEVASVGDGGLVVGHDRGEAAILVRYLEHIESVSLTFVRDIPGYAWNDPPANNYVDELVYKKLRQLQYLPSATCSDNEFLRRVYLDVIGILPTVEETEAFLADGSADKRARLIDQLLERPEHAKFWTLKWGDLLRLTSGQVGGDGVYKYHRWVEQSIRENKPYDQFARELVTATGSTLTNPPANFYRTAADMNDCVETISQIFIGARLQCAKCHNHPFERWTQDNYYGMGSFFQRVQRKKTRRPDEQFIWVSSAGEVTQPRTGKQMKPWLPVDGTLDNADEEDRRRTFAEWLTRKDNPYFARIEVNRIWSYLFSRGIVEPVDDFRESNPPANAELLDALAADFVEHGFDRRHIVRTILNSRAYQASFETNDFNADDKLYCSHQEPRLLSAEQLLDAICHVTGVPEQFGSLPANVRATQLPAPDLVKHDFLKIFGQPERQTVCACERTNESNLGMAIQFFNGPLIYGKLRHDQNRFRQMMAAGKSDEEIVRQLYLAAVSRQPAEKELAAALGHLQGKEDRAAALEDVCWALINTNEFLFQH